MKMKYPDMRKELMVNLSILADPEMARKEWVLHEYDSDRMYSDFDMTFSFIVDDMCLDMREQQLIGTLLYDQEELEKTGDVAVLLVRLIDTNGNSLSDKEYMQLPEWNKIVDASRNAFELIVNNNKKYSFT